jgi:hypothetical protein
MSKQKISKRPEAATVARTYRFDVGLFGKFEADCDQTLRNPRLVLEALIHHWLTADSKTRSAIADGFSSRPNAASKSKQ